MKLDRNKTAFFLPSLLGFGSLGLMAFFLYRSASGLLREHHLLDTTTRCANGYLAALAGIKPTEYLALIIPASVLTIFASSLTRQFFRTRKFLRALKLQIGPETNARISLTAAALGLKKTQFKLIDSDLPLCFCAGFVFPKLYLSRGTLQNLENDELTAVVAHEKRHLTNRDPLRSSVLRALGQALFFIPLMAFLEKRYSLSKEITADAEALSRPKGRLNLAAALYKLSTPRIAAENTALSRFADETLIEIRLAYIAGKGHPLSWPSFFKIAVNVAALSAILALMAPPAIAEAHQPACQDEPTMVTEKIKSAAINEYSSAIYYDLSAENSIKLKYAP